AASGHDSRQHAGRGLQKLAPTQEKSGFHYLVSPLARIECARQYQSVGLLDHGPRTDCRAPYPCAPRNVRLHGLPNRLSPSRSRQTRLEVKRSSWMTSESRPAPVRFAPDPFGAPFRTECDIQDCEVDGEIPLDLSGAFYRVGPDFQYPPRVPNIPFDGEGHVAMFRISKGHADFRTRYVRTQRFKAQREARQSLFGTYRNPHTDDPRVKKVSRGTANTNIIFHAGKLLALKEDSPPVVMDPRTLDTLDDYYTFGGKLESLTFTAHPKIDSSSGEMIGFGYEAKGEATDDVAVFSIGRNGKLDWSTWIKVPYVGMLHDFAVTDKH